VSKGHLHTIKQRGRNKLEYKIKKAGKGHLQTVKHKGMDTSEHEKKVSK
jgi:ribosomal protein S6